MNKKIMRKMGMGHRVDLVEAGKCPDCEEKINKKDFKDEVSKNEFKISGMCQKCQDNFFRR
jgi:hypothetical protein